MGVVPTRCFYQFVAKGSTTLHSTVVVVERKLQFSKKKTVQNSQNSDRRLQISDREDFV